MKFCTKCGAQLNDDDIFCPKCGHKVNEVVKKDNTSLDVDDQFYSTTLINYFNGANTLELRKYSIEQLLNNINSEIKNAENRFTDYTLTLNSNKQKINSLNKKMEDYKEAIFVKQNVNTFEFKKTSFFTYYMFEDYIKAVFINSLLLVVLIIAGIVLKSTLLEKIYYLFFNKSFVGALSFLAVLLFVLPVIYMYIIYSIDMNNRKNKLDAENNKKVANVEESNNKREKEHLEKEAKKKADFFKKSQNDIDKMTTENIALEIELAYLDQFIFPNLDTSKKNTEIALQKQQDALDKYYSVNIIYPKYRKLIPVATMMEYLESGRVNRLTSTEGAYNIYEQELRQDLIIGRLDELIEINKRMLSSQYSLMDAINSVRNEVGRLTNNIKQLSNESLREKQQIIDGMKQIAKSNELNNYYAKLTNDNIADLKYLEEERDNYLRYSKWY